MDKKISRRKELGFPYQEAEGFEIPKLNISKSIDDVPNPKYHTPSHNKPKSFEKKDGFDKKGGYEKKEYSDRKPRFDKKDGYEKKEFSDRKPRFDRNDGYEKKEFSDRKPRFDRNDGYEKKEFSDKKPRFDKKDGFEKREFSDRKPRFDKKDGYEKKDFSDRKPRFDKKDGFEKREFSDRKDGYEKRGGFERKSSYDKKAPAAFDKFSKDKKSSGKLSLKDKINESKDDNRAYRSMPLGKMDKSISHKEIENRKKAYKDKNESFEVMPLNKYIAKCGVCSRREAVDIIKSKRIKIGHEVIDSPGFKVEQGMNVYLDDKKVVPQENKVYILLNKPKGYITTLDDPKGRRIITDLYKNQIKERIYPVGRLDRNTTGIIILTNDGELSQQLTHPKYDIKKIYQVELDKKLSEVDFKKIQSGLELEDGPIQVDDISYLEDKKTIGVEIHSGRNRIVRRIFEHLGYSVEKLDRVYFAGLTKKNLMRGKYRHLTDQEIINLKHLGKKKNTDKK